MEDQKQWPILALNQDFAKEGRGFEPKTKKYKMCELGDALSKLV